MFVEVNFRRNGFSKVYFDGSDVVIDNGVNKYRRRVKKQSIYDLLIAIGEFAGMFSDEIIDYEVIE